MPVEVVDVDRRLLAVGLLTHRVSAEVGLAGALPPAAVATLTCRRPATIGPEPGLPLVRLAELGAREGWAPGAVADGDRHVWVRVRR